MNWLFGKKKQTDIKVSRDTEQNTNKSIEKMHETVELLEKRQKLLLKKMDEETAKAKEFVAKNNKPAAMRCLKNKKTHQAQYDKLSAQITNMTTMIAGLENAAIDVETLKAQQQGANALKQIYKETGGIDKVEDMVDDVRETMDRAKELSEALSQSIGDPLDEDELEDELNALEEETLDSQLDQIGSLDKTKIPTGPIAAKKKKQADEFADLEAELSAL